MVPEGFNYGDDSRGQQSRSQCSRRWKNCVRQRVADFFVAADGNGVKVSSCFVCSG